MISMVGVLVAHIRSPSFSMSQPMSRNQASSVFMPAELTALAGAGVCRPSGMDGHLWGSTLPTDISTSQTRNLPDRPCWDERYQGTSCQSSLQDLLALSCSVVEVGWHARLVAPNLRHNGPFNE